MQSSKFGNKLRMALENLDYQLVILMNCKPKQEWGKGHLPGGWCLEYAIRDCQDVAAYLTQSELRKSLFKSHIQGFLKCKLLISGLCLCLCIMDRSMCDENQYHAHID